MHFHVTRVSVSSKLAITLTKKLYLLKDALIKRCSASKSLTE